MLIRMTRTRSLLVPFALCAMGAITLCFQGCKKKSEATAEPPPAHAPSVYMKDQAFRRQLADKRKELGAIVNERAPLVARMEELVRSNGQDKAVLEKIPEWTNLHARVTALNAKYDETRKRQLAIARERLTPAANDKQGDKKISK